MLAHAKEKGLAQEGDHVVVSFGEVDGVPGNTNSMKVIRL